MAGGRRGKDDRKQNKFVPLVEPREDWILRGPCSSSFRLPRNLSNHMERQARTSDTVLVNRREMTGRSQTLPWCLGGGGIKTKDDRKQNTLAPVSTCIRSGAWILAVSFLLFGVKQTARFSQTHLTNCLSIRTSKLTPRGNFLYRGGRLRERSFHATVFWQR